jgi:hypothetical protein
VGLVRQLLGMDVVRLECMIWGRFGMLFGLLIYVLRIFKLRILYASSLGWLDESRE